MVDVYFLFTEDFTSKPLDIYEKYLSAEEKDCMSKFLFQKDKDQYLLTRTLVRKVLSQRLGKRDNEIEFEINSYGKPNLTNNFKDIVFNVSHTNDLIVMAVAENAKTIGIDVENCSKKIDLSIRKTFLTQQELIEFDKLSRPDQKNRLLILWTLKESYMKAIGKGFSLSPKSFSFLFRNGKEIQFHENPTESALNEFSFQLFEYKNLFKIALCHTKEFTKVNTVKVMPYWEYEYLHNSFKLLN